MGWGKGAQAEGKDAGSSQQSGLLLGAFPHSKLSEVGAVTVPILKGSSERQCNLPKTTQLANQRDGI